MEWFKVRDNSIFGGEILRTVERRERKRRKELKEKE